MLIEIAFFMFFTCFENFDAKMKKKIQKAHYFGLLPNASFEPQKTGQNTESITFRSKLSKQNPLFDQHLKCAAPKYWSKYTTNYYYSPLYVFLSTRPSSTYNRLSHLLPSFAINFFFNYHLSHFLLYLPSSIERNFNSFQIFLKNNDKKLKESHSNNLA